MSLREKQIRETRSALLKAGRNLFTVQGYDAASAEEIVSAAGLTRGALYHHFKGGKRGLFEAVFAELQSEAYAAVIGARRTDGTSGAEQISAYLEIACRPDYRRVVLIDGPAVLGWSAWHSDETERWMEAMRNGFDALPQSHRLQKLDRDMMASILFGALGEAALRVSAAPDPMLARKRALEVFRALIDSD